MAEKNITQEELKKELDRNTEKIKSYAEIHEDAGETLTDAEDVRNMMFKKINEPIIADLKGDHEKFAEKAEKNLKEERDNNPTAPTAWHYFKKAFHVFRLGVEKSLGFDKESRDNRASYRDKLAAKDEEIASLKEKIERIESEEERREALYEVEKAYKEKPLIELKSELSQLEDERNALTARRDYLEENIDNRKEMAASLTEELGRAEEKVKDLKANELAIHDRFKGKILEGKDEYAGIKKAGDKFAKEFVARTKGYEKIYEGLEKATKKIDAKFKKDETKLRAKVEVLKKKGNIDKAMKVSNKLEALLDVRDRKVNKVKGKIFENIRNNAEYELGIKLSDKDIETYMRTMSAYTRGDKEFDTAKWMMEYEDKNSVFSKVAEAEKLSEKLDYRNSKEFKDNRKAIEQAGDDIKKYKDKIKETEKTVEELTSKLADETKRIAPECSKLTEKIENIEAEIKNLGPVVVHKDKSRSFEAKERIQDLSDRIDEIKQEKKDIKKEHKEEVKDSRKKAFTDMEL